MDGRSLDISARPPPAQAEGHVFSASLSFSQLRWGWSLEKTGYISVCVYTPQPLGRGQGQAKGKRNETMEHCSAYNVACEVNGRWESNPL
jgi:hypothetical protein